jgi:serine protease
VKAGASDRPSLLALSEAATDLRMKMSQATVDRNALFADEATRAKWHTTLSIKALRRDPAVAYAEPNYRVHSFAVPNDEYYPYQWHYALINLPGAWDTTGGSSSVTVAVIDTGVLLGHPDLAGQLVSGFDFIRDPTNSRDGDGIDANPDDPGDQQFGGSSFHGTHVAGTIAAASNNATGVAGVASGVRIMPLRVLGARGGSGYDIMQAVLYAAGLPNDSGRLPARRADVINLSLGGGAPSQAEQDVFSQARRQGVVIVAAAGNSTSSAPAYPASYQGVISVSAVGLRKTRASYSNYGASVDVAAPGGDSGDWNGDGYVDGILSTGGDDTRGSRLYNFRFMQGTSMAAPHVAGVVALMKSVNPALTPDDVDRLLAAGRITEDLGVRGRDDEFGYGLIDARKAVTAASSGSAPAPAPALDASPRSLSFGGGGSAQEILVRNAGTGTLQVTGVTATVPWIAVTRGASVDADGLGRYVVTVNRTGLPVGTHSGHVEVRANAGTSRIPVLMEVNARAQIGDAGQQYVLLLDPVSGDSRYQVDVRSEGGVYRFRFDGVAPGRYELYSGTDADNDGYVCDAGESCGAYRTLDQPSEVEVTGATSLEAFSIGFDATIRVNGTPPGTLPASATGFRRIR